ncbi:oligosaccharyl transferase beta subunit [Crassisporium funariophilum]|nr:oligosaccharyl transferase beta subunit [Crassisporium funariophilum]
MFSFRKLLFLAAGLASLVNAKSSTGNSVLVVVEPKRRDDFSIFFDGLKDQGYELTFRSPKDESPAIIQYDEPSFAHVILLASETKNFAKDITPQSLIQLLNLKTNLIVALSTKQTPLSSLAAEFSLILPPPGTPLISYFPKRDEPASLMPITPPSSGASSTILSKGLAPVWFSGIPMALGNNPLLVPILNAPAQSFAAEVDGGSADAIVDAAEKGGEGLWAGSQLGVVTGFQTLNGARITWVGGVDVFSDELAQKEISKGVKSGNTQLALDIAAWTLQESLVLRIDKTEHHLLNATEPSELYTNNDQLVYNAYISKFNPKQGTWEPYSGLRDLQLEFTMLDPHIRTALPPVSGTPGKYSVTFRAPDRHGVFKFVIDHKRKGWTHLHSSTTVPVVPPRHDGYPRFLSAAWPYYAGAISTSVAFFLFSAMWLAGEVRETKKPGKAGKTE